MQDTPVNNVFDFLLDNAQTGINTRKLGKFLGLQTFDIAFPQEWGNKVRELGMDPSYTVFCYDEPTPYGGPRDLAKMLLERIQKDMPEFGEKIYLLETAKDA